MGLERVHEPMIASVENLDGRLTSRRGAMLGSAKLLGGGALALAIAGGPVVGRTRSALAQSEVSDFEDVLAVFNYALTLEHLENAFYRDGLAELDAAAFEAVGYDAQVREYLVMIGEHEQAHVDVITQTISEAGGTPVEEAQYDFGYDDAGGFMAVAQALENTGVQAYTGAAPFIDDDALLTAALTIHGVEARHAAYLNEITGAAPPFPDALEPGLSREEVLAIAGPFIVS